MPPRRLLPRVAACTAALALAAGAAAAHDTWLVPGRASLPPGVDATFALTSGGAYPALESAIAPERVVAARVRLGGRTAALPAPTKGARALRFRVPLRQPGVATVWVSLAPRTLTLDSAAVMHYLDEIAAPDSVRLAYLRQLPVDGRRRWRERYAKHAVAHVLVSSPLRPRPPADSSWARPAGLRLELLPLRDPTALRAGDTLAVRLLRRGAPLAEAAVSAAGPDGRALAARRTDEEGTVAFVLPSAGRWLLRTTDVRRAERGGDWASDFATLTVAVK
jgi:hypothetical protein